jgi:formate dehydrogenase alpha subunit
MSVEYVPTICPYCGCGCGIYLVVKEEKIIGVEPWNNHPVNEGKNCPKGRNSYKFLYSDDRLKTPLIKKDGRFIETSWRDALRLIKEQLENIDPDSFGIINSGKLMNEDLYTVQKFARVVAKTNNLDNCSRFCHSTTVPALTSTVGSGVMTTSQINIEKADCIFIAGVNLKETYPLIARRVIKAKKKGAKVIVADPRKTLTARLLADIHLQLYPGTDILLINSIMKTILEERLESKEFIRERTKGFNELKTHLDSVDLDKATRLTQVSLDQIKEAAHIYGRAEKACILYNAGIAQHIGGIGNIRSLSNLALLTGNYGRPGTGVNPLRGHINGEGFGDMGPVPVFYPGFKPVNEESAKQFQGSWNTDDLPSSKGMPYMSMMEKCKTLYIIGANPMVSAPNTQKVKEMLEKKDLLIVQDIYLTETAELADIILPAATWSEKDGTITQVDRRVQRINRAVYPPGESKADWQIICELASEMGYSEEFNYHSSEEIFEEIRRNVPQYRGITYKRLEKAGGIQWPCPTETHTGTDTMFVDKFATPDGLGAFQIVEYSDPQENIDEDYPYVLTNGRNIFHYHSGTMTRRTTRLNNEVGRGYVQINSLDARKEGIDDNEEIVLRSRRGEIHVISRLSDDILRGVLFLPWHFPENSPNVLTSSLEDPVSKMPEFKFCPVSIIKNRVEEEQ